jgi:hypothetical protein
VSREAEEPPLLRAVTKQRLVKTDWEGLAWSMAVVRLLVAVLAYPIRGKRGLGRPKERWTWQLFWARKSQCLNNEDNDQNSSHTVKIIWYKFGAFHDSEISCCGLTTLLHRIVNYNVLVKGSSCGTLVPITGVYRVINKKKIV